VLTLTVPLAGSGSSGFIEMFAPSVKVPVITRGWADTCIVLSVDVISKVKSDTARPYPTSLGVPFIVSL
jgi:hypothetical protein